MKDTAVVCLILSSLTAAAQTPISIDPVGTQAGTVNVPFSVMFTAQGGTLPYSWSAASLPPGLQISPTSGQVSGTPVLSGDWFSTVNLQDALGRPAFPPALVTFSFQPTLTLVSGSNFGTPIALNQSFVLGSVGSSTPGANVTLSLLDRWIQFELGGDTTCTQTAQTIPLTTGSTPTPFSACITSTFSQYSVIALIRATSPGFPPVADGFSVQVGPFSSFVLSGDSHVDLTLGAVAAQESLGAGTFLGSPTISYFPPAGDWLQESDDCQGSALCSVLLVPLSSPSSLQVGEQVAARLDFAATNGGAGSLLAKFRYLPSTISITSQNFAGFYDWPFTASATAGGGTGPYTWSAAGLPLGVSISPDGTISGTPLQAGVTHSFLTAADALGYRTSQQVTFSFRQGAPALALIAAATPPFPQGSSPLRVGNLSSSPAGADITLTISKNDLTYFGFPAENNARASCDTLSATTVIATPAPAAVYVCLRDQTNEPPLDAALRIYVHVTATSPGFVPITVILPLQSTEVYAMQVTSPLDISTTGSGDVAVTVVSNSTGSDSSGVLTTFDSPPAWIDIAPANAAVPCSGRASCTFQVSADPSQLTAPQTGQTFSSTVVFHATGGLSAALSVVYTYSGNPLAIRSSFFSQIAGQLFTARASATGGTGSSYTWTSPDLPPTLTMSADGTILGSLASGVTQAHLTVQDEANHSVTAVVIFSGLPPQVRKVRFQADFDGDGKSDYSVWRPSNGTWYVLPSAGSGTSLAVAWGLPDDIPIAGDFDGDGKTDYAVWRPSNGTWYVILSTTGTWLAVPWGLPGDVPVAGDFDGDGKTDFAVWRPSDGTWYVIPSTTGTWFAVPWGLPGDVPVVGDFDGDGKTDFAVWRPSNGTWYVIPSTTGTWFAVPWGLGGDVPISGDFDGDGKTDYAVWRPSDGTWYVVPSMTGTWFAVPWGLAGDVPISGDFDGDGKTDYAVWRPSDGTWYVVPSSTRTWLAVPWGLAGDIAKF